MITIDIIMPCYYSSEVIRPCFERIANQTIIDNITLIMINDCSPFTDCEYQDLRNEYKNRIKIRYFKTEKNIGPGNARQLGLNIATSDFIWFQDDDDEIYANNSLELLINTIKTQDFTHIASISGFNKMINDFNQPEIICSSLSKIQGTLFNRLILKNLNIYFESILSFKEEDCTFSALFDIKTFNYKHLLINDIVYLHKICNNHISITGRINYKQSILNLLYSKTIILFYLNSFNTSNELQTTFINECVALIPNLLISLIYLLMRKNIILTQEEYNNIDECINYYINMNLNPKTITEPPDFIDEIFDKNIFYGEYNLPLNYNFNQKYKSYLSILKNYLTETE